MVALTDSLISSAARPLHLRMRPGLTVRLHRYQGQRAWVVKDPISLQYFRLREEEFAVLESLDGQRSLDDLKELYENRFPPHKITLEELAQFVGNLHQSGLIVSLLPDQGRQLKQRRDERKRRQWLSAFSNILAIRIRGIDPHRVLDRLLPYTWWFFTPIAAAVFLLFGLSAVTLVAVHFDSFCARLPAFHEFFAVHNWIYLAVALMLTKIMHELGHGLSCRRYGGECHEIGVLLLVLTPCLYCEVSDSWMLKSKWQRAFIGAAGMYVELVIASAATFLWWYSVPGLLNNLMLSTMFVCSVSTLLFNANPLLRYDGYYILADLLEIPNLRQKATSVVGHKLGAWCLGLEEPEDRYLPRSRRVWFAVYSLASIAYRWVVVIMILSFLYKVLEPYGLKAVGQMLTIAALLGLIGQPLWALKQYLCVPGRLDKIRWGRLLWILGAVGGPLVAVLALPLPHGVYCPLEIEPHNSERISVEVPGVLVRVHVHPGQQVQAGDVLADLDNLDARLEVARLQGQFGEAAVKLDMLTRQRHSHDSAGKEADLQIAETQQSLDSVKQQLEKRERELERLTLRSHRAGTVLPAAMVQGTPHVEGALPTWSGTPLDDVNQGTWLPESQQLCYVGDPNQLEAVLVVDQADVHFVKEGQEVVLMIDALSGKTIRGYVADIAPENLKATSQQLSTRHGGDVETRIDPNTGRERPTNPSYQARVVLDNHDHVLRLGLKGEARIQVASESLFTKAWRYLSRTFYFK